MCNKDIESYKFMCVGVIFLAFNVLLHTKSEQKVIGNCFCTTITFNDPLKIGFSIINLLLQFMLGMFECNRIFLI